MRAAPVSVSVRRQRARLVTLLVLAAACAARLVYLDADPPFVISRDFITDELWWSLNARNAYLFGVWQTDEFNQGLASPLFSLLQLAAFRLFGLSLAALRASSALSGMLACVAVAALTRAHWSWRRTAIATAFFSLSQLGIFYARLAFVETAMTAAFLWALVCWDRRHQHGWAAFAAGLAVGVSLAVKSSAVLLLPGMVLVLLSDWYARELRRRDVALFTAGLSLSVGALAVAVVVPHAAEWLRVHGWVGLDPAGAPWSLTGALHLPFNSFFRTEPVLTVLALVGLGRLYGRGDAAWRRDRLTRLCVALLAGEGAAIACLTYQPERRLLPLLFPLAILATRAVTTSDGRMGSARRTRLVGAAVAGAVAVCFVGPDGWLAVASDYWHLAGLRDRLSHSSVPAAVVALLVTAAAFYARRPRVAVARLVRVGVPLFLAFDLTAVGVALATPSFTLRAAIERLATLVPAGPNLIGITPALNTRGPIITYLPHVGVNAAAPAQHPGAWLVTTRVDDGRAATSPWRLPDGSTLQATLELCPFGSPRRPRFVFELWRLGHHSE